MIKRLRTFLLALSYARRDIRAGFKGFYIFLACIILSVATITCVHSVSLGMKSSLYHDGRYILGGDIDLKTMYEPATKEQLKFIHDKMGPITIVMETRAMALSMKGDSSTLVELKAVDPFYPLYGKVEIVDAAGDIIDVGLQDLLVPPRAYLDEWGAVVEKGLMSRLKVKIGDQIKIGKQEFEIRGIISKEPDRVGGRGFSFAPRVMISRYTFDETGLRVFGSQVHYHHKILMPQIKTREELKAAQDKIEKAFPEARWRGKNFLNASPRTERMIDRLTLFLTFISLTTLLIAGIGIANAVRAFLDSKMRDIATLKCLGGSEHFVFRVYMIEIFILATFGVMVGLLIGILTSQVGGSLLTAKLSLSDHIGIYPSALVTATVFGYLITFCASLWPIGKAVRTSPTNLFRDVLTPISVKPSFSTIMWIVISSQLIALIALLTTTNIRLMLYFIAGLVVTFITFYMCAAVIKIIIKKVHLPTAPEMRMAMTNLYRPGNITTSTVLSIGIGLTVLIAVALIQYNFSRLVKEDISVDVPSFFFLDIEPAQLEQFKQITNKIETARGLNIVPSLRGRIVSINGVPAREALIDKNEGWIVRSDRGFTYTSDLPANSEIVEGEWWSKDYKGKPIVSIATNVQRAFDIGVGDEIIVNIFGKKIKAEVANVRDVSWESFTLNFAITFAPSVVNEIPSNYIATLVVDEDHEETLQNKLANKFPNITSVKVRDALNAAQMIMKAASQAIYISTGITLIAGILVLSGGIAAARKRHLYDAIILKVLGGTRRSILKTFLSEYLLLAVITIVISAFLGTLSAYLIQKFIMHMPWSFSWLTLITVTILCITVTLLSGVIGTWKALKEKPAPYLRND